MVISVGINLEQGRPTGESSWELPPYGHPLAQGVYPLLVDKDGQLTPLGTAFCFSRLGFVATAEHIIRDAFRYHWRGDALRLMDQLPKSYGLNDIGLSVFHHHKSGENSYTVYIWPVENIQGAQPTDVVYGFPKFQNRFPFLPLPISFEVPRIGSRVICVGYSDTCFPDGGIPSDDIRCGHSNWVKAYRNSFRATEGRVTRIFTQRFAAGFIKGPCFAIDVEVEHGMSGGPVFNQAGYVCGVVSAGASNFFNSPASIVSLLYPTLLTGIKFGVSMGPVRLSGTQPLLTLIDRGAVLTDGSEILVTFRPAGREVEIGPMIRKEDAPYVHDDFPGYQAGRVASKETREVYRVQRQDNT